MNKQKHQGLQYVLQLLCRIQPRGLFFAGPPCNNFIQTCAVHHQRSFENPEGRRSCPEVMYYNGLAEVVAGFLDVCRERNVWFVVENPTHSVFFLLPVVAAAMARAGARRFTVWLGKYGAATPKCLQLWGTAPWLPELERIDRSLPQLAEETLCTHTASGAWTGKKQKQGESAEYPMQFCRFVACLQLKCRRLAIGAPLPAPTSRLWGKFHSAGVLPMCA